MWYGSAHEGENFMNSGTESLDLNQPLCHLDLVQLSDDVLMGHLKDGNHDALGVIFQRYHRLVFTIALRILRDLCEAEDLTQAVFLEIFRCAAQFDPVKGTTKVWIIQYAYHRSFNKRRDLALRGIHELPHDFMQAERSSPACQATRLETLESAQLLREALGSLSKKQKKTLQLVFYEGFTMREIAESNGTTLDSVRHDYYRGLEKLRSILCDGQHLPLDAPSPEEVGAYVQPRTL